MSRFSFALAIASLTLLNICKSQDTLVVQTFEWDDDFRLGVFQFPDESEDFRQVLLRYNMRCHDAKVSTNTDFEGCREWDYSCNTFVIDSGRADAVTRFHPDYFIPGWGLNDIPLTNKILHTYIERERQSVQVTGSSNLDTISLPKSLLNVIFTPNDTRAGALRMLYYADDLMTHGLEEGAIHQLILPDKENAGSLRFVRVRMRNVELDSLVHDSIFLTKDDEYFYDHVMFTPEDEVLTLNRPFMWDNTSNILVECSFRLDQDAPDNIIFSSAIIDGESVRIKQSGFCLEYQGGPGIIPENSGFERIDSQITLAFWAAGDPNYLPVNTVAVHGADNQGLRQINVHLPWSDGRLYFDCGNFGGVYDRVSKSLPSSVFMEGWHHYALTKDIHTGTMEVWIDGSLWHSEGGKLRPINIDSLILGTSISGLDGWYGRMKDFAMYDISLDKEEITQLMFRGTVPGGLPAIESLIGFYPLDDGSGRSPKGMNENSELVARFYGTPQWALSDVVDAPVSRTSLSTVMAMGFVQGNMTVSVTPETERDSFSMLTTHTQHFGVENNALILIEDLFLQLGDVQRILSEDWVVVDIEDFDIIGSLPVQELNYFEHVPARFELVSLVTPYGFDLDLGPGGKTFLFDVTDLSPVLRNNKRLEITMGGEYQTELDLRFYFIRGEPPAEIIDIMNIWPFHRAGIQTIFNDDAFEPRAIPLDPTAGIFKIRSSVTGHDQNGEFVKRNHYVQANDMKRDFDVWKECADNPVYPQGGTWIFDRAGWCPGAPTNLTETFITDAVTAGEDAVFDYGVNGLPMESANYLASHQLVSYSQPNRQVDAAVYDIIRPNDEVVSYERFNPSCQDPVIVIRNEGRDQLHSLDIRYGLKGEEKNMFSWLGNLDFLETAIVQLPVDMQDFWNAGEMAFEVWISNPNGTADVYAANDTMRSQITLVDVLDQPNVYFEFRTNLVANDNSYRILNQAGDVVVERNNLPASTTVQDYFDFPSGCYSLEVNDIAQDGLYFWYYPGNGSGWAQVKQSMPPVSFVLKTFNPDFGSGFIYDFVIDSPSSVKDKQPIAVAVYPNPVTESCFVDYNAFDNHGIPEVTVISSDGRTYAQDVLKKADGLLSVDFRNLQDGTYFLRINNGKTVIMHQVAKISGF